MGPADERGAPPPSAFVLTTSDGSFAGVRPDESGARLEARLRDLGYAVERRVVPDDQAVIADAIREAAARHRLVLTTGGTGLTPRDVTPQATHRVLDYEVPGIAETMRAEGRRSTALAALSRGLAGVCGRSLVVNLPGSPRGAMESFAAIEAILPHALETLGGPFDHGAAPVATRAADLER